MTKSIFNAWRSCGSFSLVGEIEETLLRLVYRSGCTIPTAVFRNFVQIMSSSLKIKFILQFLHSGDVYPISDIKGKLLSFVGKNSAFPLFYFRGPFLS